VFGSAELLATADTYVILYLCFNAWFGSKHVCALFRPKKAAAAAAAAEAEAQPANGDAAAVANAAAADGEAAAAEKPKPKRKPKEPKPPPGVCTAFKCCVAYNTCLWQLVYLTQIEFTHQGIKACSNAAAAKASTAAEQRTAHALQTHSITIMYASECQLLAMEHLTDAAEQLIAHTSP
jgi:hypothetical protein